MQDAVRLKEISLHKIPCETNVADLGTKPLEPKLHQELLKALPLAPLVCRRFAAVLAALLAASPAVVETPAGRA